MRRQGEDGLGQFGPALFACKALPFESCKKKMPMPHSIPIMRIRVKTDIDEKCSNISLGISGEQENSGNGTYWALLQHFFPFKWRVFTEECGAHFQVQKFLSTFFEAMLC